MTASRAQTFAGNFLLSISLSSSHLSFLVNPPEPNNTKMGRLHSKGKGISSSATPYSRNAPAWQKLTSDQVVEQIIKLARKGHTPSQIGVLLRDSHGIPQVKVATGNKILRILKSSGKYDCF